MDDRSNTSRKILRPRRLMLLASVAALGMAVLVTGPGGYHWTASAQAAETTANQNTAGFGDLVAKVKPAVISVRVKIDGDSDNTAVSERNSESEGANPDQPDQFSQQFGFRAPNGMPQHQHRRTVTP
jgi:serine protease Do